MIKQVKEMRNMENSQEVLNRIGFIQKIKEAESYKDFIGLENQYESYEKLETIAYKIAVKKAQTVEEIERCAASIEEKYCSKYDPDEWAEQIRIKAYGIEWFLEKNLHSNDFAETVEFIEEYSRNSDIK